MSGGAGLELASLSPNNNAYGEEGKTHSLMQVRESPSPTVQVWNDSSRLTYKDNSALQRGIKNKKHHAEDSESHSSRSGSIQYAQANVNSRGLTIRASHGHTTSESEPV
eukprot:CAMPEP_0185575674 /NCGR_PEP_ID=MMETSP0434-20130131/6804_1 /TAXON_ID=626734 ORGANISM="Favella taraikaensis, Strain Fe Narragansett Bay" /NCGR_SAMPLE_ID=MMETSP0434 /ASSEMBLY_ACC=CAM_ASM_000379 /LENGTH=108 /DNA_ID=CAMNT_0028192619 /DNA_START=1658 /DNA_END=1984 /DNA_ORIENTATION=+